MQYRELTSEIRDLDDNDRSFSHAISDETIDAHGSIIRVDGWDLSRFKANPVVLWAHESSGLPIGRAVDIWKDGGKLMSRTRFAGEGQAHVFAETAYRLVRDGFLRAWSVGFMPKTREKRTDLKDGDPMPFDPFVYTKCELMEYSLVPVPSNPNALNDARRAIDLAPMRAWATRLLAIEDEEAAVDAVENLLLGFLIDEAFEDRT